MTNQFLDAFKLQEALKLLDEQLLLGDAPSTGLVVCGGSALIATGLVLRTTRDIDILAFLDNDVLKDSATGVAKCQCENLETNISMRC